jgi:tetratricopeptide (TPR) repeat protein
VQLGRGQEAETTLQKALTRDPENAVTHANRGWVLLGQATPPAALEHFREALRLDPNLLPARGGLLVALKARSRLYRPFLRYYLLISGLSAGSLHTLVACSLFLFLGLNLYARENPERGAWAWVVQVFVLAFALTTWVADPLFNLKLLRDHFGRLVLSRNQVVVSRVHLAAAGLLTLALGVTGWPGMGLEKVFGCVACVVLIASLETTPQGYGERS